MEDRPLLLYIAMSLDGYIARPDGDIDWLSQVESPPEDYGYGDFIRTVDTVIMGRKTYDKVLGFGVGFPHRGRACYVLSREKTGQDENVTFFNGDVADLLAQIRQKPGKGIFCDGGAETVLELMQQNLIDRYIISIIPVLLGEGIPLFKAGRPEIALRLTQSLSFPTGLVQLWYERKE
jgi:dihydrofolate reductase